MTRRTLVFSIVGAAIATFAIASYVYKGNDKGESELLFSFGWSSRLNRIKEQQSPG